jgi:HAE1 family hydrophobic/amphiphilic exporter-1
MKIVRASIDHPVTVSMLCLAALLFGLVALGRLPLNLLPDISYPSLTVETEFPDAAPAEVENLVTKPLEEAVGVVNGVRRITSRSAPGLSQITLEFAWDTDMDYASLDVREKADLIDLPDEVLSPVLLRFDPSLDPILRIALYGPVNLVRLREVAERAVKTDLESLEGVAAARVIGGLEEEIQIDVDGRQLAQLGLPIDAVGEALASQNINVAGGRLRDREAEFLVRAANQWSSVDEISRTILHSDEMQVVRLADVAEVNRGHKERDVITPTGYGAGWHGSRRVCPPRSRFAPSSINPITSPAPSGR